MRVRPIASLQGELSYIKITKGVIVRGVPCEDGDLVELTKREAAQLCKHLHVATEISKEEFDEALEEQEAAQEVEKDPAPEPGKKSDKK